MSKLFRVAEESSSHFGKLTRTWMPIFKAYLPKVCRIMAFRAVLQGVRAIILPTFWVSGRAFRCSYMLLLSCCRRELSPPTNTEGKLRFPLHS